MSYIGNEPIVSATRTVTEVSATAGQTVFTANGGYTVGFIDVFVNGSKLTNSDFTATNGTTITLNEAAQASDIVRLEALGTFLTGNHVPLVGDSNITGNVNVSGNVGIGTSSPGTRLQIGNPADANQALRFDFSDSSTARINSTRVGAGNLQSLLLAGQDTMQFQTSGTERMRIDSSGRVTMPYQPAFSAYSGANNNVVYSAGSTIVFNQTRFNTGNHYNTSTGRFTAPVAGAYLFCLNIYSNDVDYRRYRLLKNGTDAFCGQGGTYGNGDQSTSVGVVYLNANDYVIVNPAYNNSTVFQEANHTTFSGYLIG